MKILCLEIKLKLILTLVMVMVVSNGCVKKADFHVTGHLFS